MRSLYAALLAQASCWTIQSQHARLTLRRALNLETDERWPGWTESVDPTATLLYMPFLDTQLRILEELGAVEAPDAVREDLRLGTRPRRADDDAKGAARVGSRVFEVPGMFRRVRMTYFDGGQSLQVFNSLWYPSFDRPDAPLLGIDLLRFGPKKFLCIVDAQPPQGRKHASHATAALDAIKQKYPELNGKVSSRYYDDNRFFSKQMLYGRFPGDAADGERLVREALLPAFGAYVGAYVDAVEGCGVDAARDARPYHADYDAFNAARDPAHGLFTSYFGEEWSDGYLGEFLFALAHESEGDGEVGA
jgi:15,16-dihydrobiliverdin:ferredoxin oxidoreductase